MKGGRGGRDLKRSGDLATSSDDKRPRLEKAEVAAHASTAAPVADRSNKPLHPSWVAKQQQKKSAILPFQGKKVVFNDDDD